MTDPQAERNLVGWFEIYVQDLDRARLFYETVFQITLNPLDTPTSGIRCLAFPHTVTRYGIGGALVKMDGFTPAGSGGTIVYFHSEDCAVELERALAAGGELVRPKFSIGRHGAIALVRDCEGTLIGLHSMQ